jgi:hypothetical protein
MRKAFCIRKQLVMMTYSIVLDYLLTSGVRQDDIVETPEQHDFTWHYDKASTSYDPKNKYVLALVCL